MNLVPQKTSEAGLRPQQTEITTEAMTRMPMALQQTMRNVFASTSFWRESLEAKETRIKTSIARIGVTIGAKPPESEEEQLQYALLITQIIAHYPKTTPEEMVQAFELNCVGSHWETIEGYGKIDFPFFAKVMKAYAAYRTAAVREFNIKLTNVIKEKSTPKKPEDEYNEEQYHFIVEFWKSNREWPFGDYHAAWIHFWKINRLKRADVEPWFKTESEKIVAELIELRKQETSELSIQAIDLKLHPDAVKAECRRRFLQMSLEKTDQDGKK